MARILTALAVSCALAKPATSQELPLCFEADEDRRVQAAAYGHMVAGRYGEAFNTLDTDNRFSEASELKLREQLEHFAPHGFGSCQLIVRKKLSDVLTQEIAVFVNDGATWVYLHSIVLDRPGKQSVVHYNAASDILDVLKHLQ